MRILLPVLVLLGALATPLVAGQKKPPVVSIRLFGEGNEREGESFVTSIDLVNPQKRIFIRKVPVINERDFRAFFPFPARDGSIGAYFLLDAHGTDKLVQFTTEARGQLGVVMVNGRIASAMRIERPVRDGIFMVPNGILPAEVTLLEAHYPVIGKESEFGQKKPKEPKPKPEKEKKEQS